MGIRCIEEDCDNVEDLEKKHENNGCKYTVETAHLQPLFVNYQTDFDHVLKRTGWETNGHARSKSLLIVYISTRRDHQC